MAKRKKETDKAPAAQQAEQPQETPQAEQAQETPQAEAQPSTEDRIAELQQQLDTQKKEYLFLAAEFENYRRRVLREKEELIRNGAERAMKDLLPVVDDLERALAAMAAEGADTEAVKQGVELIYNKFLHYLKQQHVSAIDSNGKEFDTDFHEAVTMFPAPSPDMRGKVVDTTLKGYMINDKVLRHAKVVVGQ